MSIAVGQTVGQSAVLTVTPVSDDRVEGDETIVFSAAAPSGYTAIADASLSITDDDDDSVTLSLDKSDVLEWDGDPDDSGDQGEQPVTVTAEFTGKTVSDLAGATVVTVSVAGGSGGDGAAAGVLGPPRTGDFSTDQSGDSFTVSIGAGEVSGSGSFALRAHADAVVEAGGEKVEVSGVLPGSTVAAAELTIHDAVVTLGFTDTGDPPEALTGLDEDGGEQRVRVSAEVPAPVPADVTIIVAGGAAGGTAGWGDDYTITSAHTSVAISSGDTSGSSDAWSFTPFSDRVFEDDETIRFTGTVDGYTVEDADLLIFDADRTVVITLDPSASTLEGENTIEDGVIVLRELGDPDQPSQSDECKCNAGSRGVRPGYTIRVDGVASSTYSQNLSMRISGFSGTAEYRHGEEVGSGFDDYTSEIDDGSNPSKMATLPAGQISIVSPGFSNAEKLNTWVDRVAEADETFTLGVRPVDRFTFVNIPGLIIDDDVQINLSTGDASVAEGSSGTDVSVSASMHADSSQLTSNTEVALSVVEEVDPGVGILSDEEFSFVGAVDSSVTVAAGDTSSSASAVLRGLSVTDDTVVEGPERLQIEGAPALAAGASQEVTFREAVTWVTVSDDDADITLSASPGVVVEKAGAQTITVTASFAGASSVLTSDTDVVMQVAAGTATATTDFTLSGLDSNDRLTVTIPAGRTSGSNTFELTAVVDSVTEASGETVTFAESGTTNVGGTAVTVTGGSLTINDPGQEVTLSLTNTATPPAPLSAVGEDDGAQTVRVTAAVGTAPASDLDVAVTVGVGGTALLSDDYTVSASSVTITIAGGATSGSADVTVTPAPDKVTEDHETIRFAGSAAGYAVAPASLSITDADRTITLEIDNPVYRELNVSSGNLWRQVTARLSGESSTYSGNIRGRVLIDNGVATFGGSSNDALHALEHILPAFHRYISIGAGSLSGNTSFNISVFTDTIAEPPENFYVKMTGVPAGFTVERAEASIVDRVDTAVVLTPNTTTVAEGGNGSEISVTAGFPSGVTSSTVGIGTGLTVDLEGGTADADDFSWTPPSSAAVLIIPAMRTSSTDSTVPAEQRFALSGLSVVDDSVVEGPETLRLSESYALGDEVREAEGSLTIIDDDTDVELSVSPGTVVEGTTGEVRVTARFKGDSSALTSDTTVTVQVASGDGTGAASLGSGSTDDFTTDATNDRVSVVIPAGSLLGSATFNLTAAADSSNEGVETGNLTGSASIGGQTLTVTGTTVNIGLIGFQGGVWAGSRSQSGRPA